MTVLGIIKRALRLLGVSATNETPDSPEAKDALSVLNLMIDSWDNEKLFCYAMKNTIFTVSANTATYTIGPTNATWSGPRPIRIERMFLRDNVAGNNNDYNLEMIPNDKYQEIFQKSITSTYPQYAWYLPAFPNGTITLWPVPTRAMQANVSQWSALTDYDLVADEILLPPGYEMALSYGLAYHYALEYGGDPKKYEKQMLDAKANIKRVNTEPLYLQTDSALEPRSRRTYNIYGDRW